MSRRPDEVWKNYFDIVILPSPSVRDHAIVLSRKVSQYGGKFVLARRRYMPHISLYHIPVRPGDFNAFSEGVKQIAADSKGGQLNLRKIEMPVLTTDRPAWLEKLHRNVIRRTVKYFDWDYDVESLWHADYLPAKLKAQAKRNLETYGSPLIGKAFRPHITLTSFEDKSVGSEVPVPQFEPMVFDVDSISICELGPSHSCQRLIATYSF